MLTKIQAEFISDNLTEVINDYKGIQFLVAYMSLRHLEDKPITIVLLDLACQISTIDAQEFVEYMEDTILEYYYQKALKEDSANKQTLNMVRGEHITSPYHLIIIK